jgi:hypothetical protein
MTKSSAPQANAQFDRIAATCAALVIVGLVVFLLIRNEEIADPRLFFALRLVLSFGTAVLGATIPGFLAIGWSGSGLSIRAGGALALFVLTYLYTPDLVIKQGQAAQVTISAPDGVAAAQITNSPIRIGLSPEELRRTVKDLSKDSRVSSEARVQAEIRAAQLAAQLNLTQEVVIGLLRNVGEQNVPPEQIALKLGEIAAKHRALMDRVSALDTANPATAAVAAQAKAAIEAGHYVEANAALSRVPGHETATARQAEQPARDAQQPAAAGRTAQAARPPAAPTRTNLLAQANGGEVLVAPNDLWLGTNDGKEDRLTWFATDSEAVYGFKDERPATFDTFSVLIPASSPYNLKDFELLVGNDSPTGTFRSIGRFSTLNVKLMRTPYQEFKFDPVTAKYLKVKLLLPHSGSQGNEIHLFEFRLMGTQP